jgi:two-component system cell cycle sensor histidine kinase/response regulator CckA
MEWFSSLGDAALVCASAMLGMTAARQPPEADRRNDPPTPRDPADDVLSALAPASRQLSRESAHRLEVIGQLAGGIAHEFNNLLTVMQGHLDGLAADLPPSPAVERRLDTLRRAVSEAGRITGGLLTFAGRSPVSPSVVDLGSALRELAPVVEGLVGESVTVRWDLDDEPLPVAIDRPHFSQLLVNLALNARDAMPGGGRLTIAARRLAPEGGGLPGGALPGDAGSVAISVTDSGAGMTDDIRAQIFDPFFTTKERPGRGSGLGLSICLGIAAQAGGRIDVASAPGRGTSMVVCLPVAGALAEPPAVVQATAPVIAALTVLLVEDEPDVRDIVGEILRRNGHRVMAAEGVDGVRRLLASRPAAIDLLLTDLVLADGTGLEAAALVAAHDAAVPVLYMSGYSEAVFSGDHAVDHLLRKPFTSATLLDALHRVAGSPADRRR